MKKLITTIILSLSVVSFAIAQDMAQATELYNAGASELNLGNTANAVSSFEKALKMAETLGAEGETIVAKCKEYIPRLYLAIGKEKISNKDIENGIEDVKKAMTLASEYGDIDTEMEAESLIPEVFFAQANSLLNGGKFAEAIAEYNKVIEINPTNAIAYLRMGMAASRLNDEAVAVQALAKAAELGQKQAANKELSTFFLKKSNEERKAKNHQAAVEYGIKSNEVLENAQALKIIGLSSFDLKKFNDAISAFESYLALSPNAKDANQTMYQLAVSYESINNKEKACGYYKKITSDPTFKEFAEHKIKNDLKCN